MAGMKVARRAHVPPFAVMEILAAANARRAAGEDVLNLCAGEPSTGASDVVRQRAIDLLTSGGGLGYTEALGVPALRSAIAQHYRDRYDVALDPRRVAVTTGSSGGFVLAFLAAFDVGDRVALAVPGYPAYANILAALGCEVVIVPCGPETRYQPTVAQLDGARPAGGRAGGRQPGQPDRHDDRPRRARRARGLVRRRTASGWSATRSTTASRTAPRRPRPPPTTSTAAPSSSTRSPSTGR